MRKLLSFLILLLPVTVHATPPPMTAADVKSKVGAHALQSGQAVAVSYSDRTFVVNVSDNGVELSSSTEVSPKFAEAAVSQAIKLDYVVKTYLEPFNKPSKVPCLKGCHVVSCTGEGPDKFPCFAGCHKATCTVSGADKLKYHALELTTGSNRSQSLADVRLPKELTK